MNKFVKSTVSVIMCLCMLIPMFAFFSSAAGVAQVKNLKSTAYTSSSITLEWDKISGVRGYKVYSYNSSQKKWVHEKTTAKTTLTVSDLTSAKSYKFRVRAFKGTDSITYGAYSATLTTSTAPAQVKGLTASGNTTSSLTLSWKAVKRATGYRAYVFDSKTSTWKKMGATTATSCKVSGLTAGQQYKFKVNAYYNNGSKDFVGSYSSILTSAAKPAKVKGLTAIGTTQTTVTLTWNKVSGANKYQVYRFVNNEWSRVTTTSKTSCTVSANSKTVQYKVRACVSLSDKNLYGAFSDVVKASASKTPLNPKAPKAPTNLNLSVDTNKKCINLSWSGVKGVNGYQVEAYDYGSGSWEKVALTSDTSYSYPVNNTAAYYFRVRSYVIYNSKTYYSDYTPAAGIEYTAPGNPDDESLSDLERYGILGYMYDPKENCFYNTVDAIHRVAGFTPIYDAAAPFVVIWYSTVRFDFNYNNLDWRIQLWKGQYGWCFIGGEAGVYTKEEDFNVAGLYACASDENMLQMSMAVYHNGKKLFTRPYGYYWWCTGYVFGVEPGAMGSIVGKPDTSSLTMLLRITLKDAIMTKAFCRAIEKEGFKPVSDYIVSGNDVILTWT